MYVLIDGLLVSVTVCWCCLNCCQCVQDCCCHNISQMFHCFCRLRCDLEKMWQFTVEWTMALPLCKWEWILCINQHLIRNSHKHATFTVTLMSTFVYSRMFTVHCLLLVNSQKLWIQILPIFKKSQIFKNFKMPPNFKNKTQLANDALPQEIGNLFNFETYKQN